MKLPLLLAAIVLGLPSPSQAGAPSDVALPAGHPPVARGTPAKPAPSPWAGVADYTITLKVPPGGAEGHWRIRTFASPADVVVDFDTPGAKARAKGSIMLVGGRAIATHGYTPEAGFEIDPLDIAIVNLKILTRLLDAAVPGGPASLKGTLAVDASDGSTPIVASTPGTQARFGAPWSLKGTVSRSDAGTIAFRLALDAAAGDGSAARARWAFSGSASGTIQGRALDDSTSLAGWTAWRLGPPPNAKPAHAALKLGATRLAGPFATVKDLRAALD